MKIINVQEKSINGISIRTSNTKEKAAETAKIGDLHTNVDKNIVVDSNG